jgi:CheY-like chemotaxis protein
VERLHIAVAEDDPMDILALRTALDGLGVSYDLTVAIDGKEARDFILKHGRYRNCPPADVIFLDMNMPKLTGLEVLREIPDSAELPVCILTSSPRERQSIDEHFAPRKICYIAKPVDEKHLLACLLSHHKLRPIAERLAKSQ